MAAPHVTGAAAGVLGVNPGLAPWQVVTAIEDGGRPHRVTGDDHRDRAPR